MELCKNWNEVTIRQFNELQKINEDDQVENHLAIIAILSGKTKEEVEQLSLDEIRRIVPATKFIYHVPVLEKLPTRIEVNGWDYEIDYKITSLLAAGYIDIKTYTKNPDLIWDNMHKIIALFTHRVVKTWFTWKRTGEKCPADDILNHFPVSMAYPMALFFCQLFDNSIKHIQEYMIEKSQNQLKNLQKSLLRTM